MLNTKSPVPLYHQLAEIILNKIRNNEIKPGEKIQSEPELAKTYSIGRPTVREATDILVQKGILERRRGSGTFVKEKHEEIDLFNLAGTTSAFNKKGIKIEIINKDKIKLITDKTDKDNPFNNKEAYYLERIIKVDREPVLLEEIFLDKGTFKDLEAKDINKRSISSIINEDYYTKPSSGRQTFTIKSPEKNLIKALKIKNNIPLLLVKRHLNFPGGDNLVYTRIYCRTDKFVFSQNLQGV